MITSPVVRGESLKFKEEGVRDILKDVFLPWYNSLRLLIQSCDQLRIEKKIEFIYDQNRFYASMQSNSNVMDKWIVSYTQTLLNFVKQEMDGWLNDFQYKIDFYLVFFFWLFIKCMLKNLFDLFFSLSFIYSRTKISQIHRYVNKLVC